MAAAASGFLLGGMLDKEPDEYLQGELVVDEEKISACTPYLARQMSCLGRLTSGVKDTLFLGSARGAKEDVDLFTRREFVGGQRIESRKTSTQRSTQIQAARRLTALLLHVWIDVIMVASYKLCSRLGTRQGGS